MRRRGTTIAVGMLAAVSIGAGMLASPAEAWTYSTTSGRVGTVAPGVTSLTKVWTPNGLGGFFSTIVVSAHPRIYKTPGWVGAEGLFVQQRLEKWNGSQWVIARSLNTSYTIGAQYNSIVLNNLPSLNFSPQFGPLGYWRSTYVIGWSSGAAGYVVPNQYGNETCPMTQNQTSFGHKWIGFTCLDYANYVEITGQF